MTDFSFSFICGNQNRRRTKQTRAASGIPCPKDNQERLRFAQSQSEAYMNKEPDNDSPSFYRRDLRRTFRRRAMDARYAKGARGSDEFCR